MAQYTLGHSAAEQERLQRQALYVGAVTRHIWTMAGLEPGMRVLDAGPPTGLGPFAAVVGRYVLVHQPDIPAALRGLAALVRPGVVTEAGIGFDTIEARYREGSANGAPTLVQVNGGGWVRMEA